MSTPKFGDLDHGLGPESEERDPGTKSGAWMKRRHQA